jgi:hypothetical protein
MARHVGAAVVAALVAVGCVAAGACAPRVSREARSATPPGVRFVANGAKSLPLTSSDISAARAVVSKWIGAVSRGDLVTYRSVTTAQAGSLRAEEWEEEFAPWQGVSARITYPGKYVDPKYLYYIVGARRAVYYKVVTLNASFRFVKPWRGRPGRSLPDQPSDFDFVVAKETTASPWLIYDMGH